ncbi:MAG: GNAT family N-acetyltransferase [Candidatus Cybelea sp.]
MRLRAMPARAYAGEVLPLTAPLWAGRRTFDQYVEQTLEIARSPYGRRYYRTIGLYEGNRCVASFKRYERRLRDGPRHLDAIGFGAVFTPNEYRGRGYASVMLAMALDRARGDGYELAYLFSDIRPEFYAELGFRALPSRSFSLRADSLPATRLQPSPLGEHDWSGVRHVFDLVENRRNAGFSRSATTWDWIRLRMRHGSERPPGDETNLVLRRRGRVAAYVFGVRATQFDEYILEEFGFADDAAAASIPALLRAAAGDLRRVVGWLPPKDARFSLSKLRARPRSRAILMMAPLRSQGELLLNAIVSDRREDLCWATDHI